MEQAAGADRASVCRVAVFFDWQNCYRSARDAFGFKGSGRDGNVKPYVLALELAGKRLSGQGRGELTAVRIHTGQASQGRDRRTYAANRRQFQAWKNASPEVVEVIPRTLDYSTGRPREKGTDVALAIDLVRSACFEHEQDVSIVVSADTDLLPALELVVERVGATRIEVATWDGPYWAPSPLSLAGQRIRQHRLGRSAYDRLCDRTDYNIGGSATQKRRETKSAEGGRLRRGFRHRS
jgi:uncharacterized LabA/DUF88 family protein